MRLRQLEALNEQQGPNDSVMRVPDGVSLLSHQIGAGAATGLIGHDGSSASSSSSSSSSAAAASESTPLEDIELRNPLSCYVRVCLRFLINVFFFVCAPLTNGRRVKTYLSYFIRTCYPLSRSATNRTAVCTCSTTSCAPSAPTLTLRSAKRCAT